MRTAEEIANGFTLEDTRVRVLVMDAIKWRDAEILEALRGMMTPAIPYNGATEPECCVFMDDIEELLGGKS